MRNERKKVQKRAKENRQARERSESCGNSRYGEKEERKVRERGGRGRRRGF